MCTLAAIGSFEIPRTSADLPENAGTKNSILRILHFLAKLVLNFGSVSICLAQIDRLPKSDRVRPLKNLPGLSIQPPPFGSGRSFFDSLPAQELLMNERETGKTATERTTSVHPSHPV